MNEGRRFSLNGPEETTRDTLSELIGIRAGKILREVPEAEIEEIVSRYRDPRTDAGRQRIARNGYLPERTVVTGVGEVKVKVPRLKERRNVSANDGIRFSSAILPRYLRKTRKN